MQEAQSAELKAPLRNSVGAAYGKVIRHTESPRDIELRVFSMITSELEGIKPETLLSERARIIGRNQELWGVLKWCAIDDNNQLPLDLRARIVSLGGWVEQESTRILQENQPVSSLVELNKTMMRGLSSNLSGGS